MNNITFRTKTLLLEVSWDDADQIQLTVTDIATAVVRSIAFKWAEFELFSSALYSAKHLKETDPPGEE